MAGSPAASPRREPRPMSDQIVRATPGYPVLGSTLACTAHRVPLRCAGLGSRGSNLVSPTRRKRPPTLLIGPIVLALMSWGAAHVAARGRPVPAPACLPLPVRDFETPVLVPQMHAVATPSTAAVSFARLAPIRVFNLNNHDEATIRLYELDGSLSDSALSELRRLLGDVSKPDAPEYAEMDPRVIQLMFKAAYHFRAREIVVISGYRSPQKRREGFHGRGLAIDFRLPNVRLAALASYLQTLPKAGVGLYTHPQTQWVHLDSRARSYHWADASGPGVRGGGWAIGDSSQRLRQDRSYQPSRDWPDGTVASTAAVERRQCKLVATPREADEP